MIARLFRFLFPVRPTVDCCRPWQARYNDAMRAHRAQLERDAAAWRASQPFVDQRNPS